MMRNKLDGNAAGGILQEIIPFDMTLVQAIYTGCSATGAIGTLTVYMHNMGTVVRCPTSDTLLMRVAAASIQQRIFHSNKQRGIESSKRRSLMSLLSYGVICGMISVIRHRLKTLMSFYFHAQTSLASLMSYVLRLKTCKVQDTISDRSSALP
jgi:hypothetical protein